MATESECQATIEMFGQKLMDIVGVQGVGVGEDPTHPGMFRVNVYIAAASEELLSKIPRTLSIKSNRRIIEVPIAVFEIGQLGLMS